MDHSQDAVAPFFPGTPLTTEKNPGDNTTIKHRKILKGGKKADALGTSGLEERHGNESLRFFIAAHVFQTGRFLQTGTVNRHRQKSSKKKPFL